jgi:hypothetical protein
VVTACYGGEEVCKEARASAGDADPVGVQQAIARAWMLLERIGNYLRRRGEIAELATLIDDHRRTIEDCELALRARLGPTQRRHSERAAGAVHG